ncbi:radical SAM family heme chaperone HemW [Mangrovicoccus algicola]|uniref:Heme chaperone HemW n=1 Tax=Mangrovicoccus algicola TaxID=2771008 RepID=A0A8J7CV36_9RHOB|nr:radical SAM family heme chaperone HemW [Mangrovicoccus algicola]MBE3638279.1 coproporphyrinogen III oxidase [Mangrovicoccus algicola]
METWQEAGFGLYLHWPFCAAKCPYCDFNSHVTARIDQRAWTEAYLSELRRAAAETPGRILSTVFFGGGTPSLMQPETVAAILDEVRRLWPMVNDPEITLEANPTSVEAGRFAGYAAAGVNRLSMGVQSLHDEDLRRLGRLHSAAEAMAAFDIARAQFSRVSFDLIYARQGQTLDMWRSELSTALDMAVDHLSLYQLTIEPGTAFGDRFAAGRLRDLPDDDIAADMYEVTQELCDAAGLPAYEVSNHARPGSESRHNRIYWRGGDWVGIGPGAHGRLGLGGTRMATETELSPALWLRKVTETGNGETLRHGLGLTETAEEYLMMSLRLTEGTDLGRLARLGHRLDDTRVAELEEMGLLQRAGTRLRCTAQGRLVLNEILRRLMVD